MMSDGLGRLAEATSSNDLGAMQDATATVREGLARFESGIAAQRALPDGGMQLVLRATMPLGLLGVELGVRPMPLRYRAGGWALAILFDLGETGAHVLQVILFLIGVAIMVKFVRGAQRVEPFTRRS